MPATSRIAASADRRPPSAAFPPLVWYGAVLGVAVSLASTAVTVSTSAPALALPLGTVQLGIVVLRGAIAYGVRRGDRWSAWAGGFLSAAYLLLAPLAVFSSVEAPGAGVSVASLPLSIALAAGQVAASALFLAGLSMARRQKTVPGAKR